MENMNELNIRRMSTADLENAFASLNRFEQEQALALLIRQRDNDKRRQEQKQAEKADQEKELTDHQKEIDRLTTMINEAQKGARVRTITAQDAYFALRKAERRLMATVRTKKAAEGCTVIIDLHPEAKPTGYHAGHYTVKYSTLIKATYKKGRMTATEIIRTQALQGWGQTKCVFRFTDSAKNEILENASVEII